MAERDDEIRDVLDTLASLAPDGSEVPRPASQALAQLNRRMEPRPSFSWRLILMSRYKYALATLSILIVLAVALSFPGVRAAASDFLGLFRVQKFAAISISPEQMALLEEVAESGLYPGEIQMIDEPDEPRLVGSLAEAESAAGLAARTPSALGQPDSVYVTDEGSGRLIVNVESARALAQAAGADPGLIPDSLDGTAIDVTIYPGISQNWSEGTVLAQTPSPLIEYPEDVDVVAIGEALLQALGMDAAQAHRLAQDIDWTDTLLLPVPTDLATFSEVQVDGVSGLALSSIDGRNAAVLWEKNGIVYALSGAEIGDLVEVANSLP